MKWVLMMPLTLIQPRAISSTTSAYVSSDSPRPPYSSGIISPKRPISFMPSTISAGYSSSRSSCATCGRISLSTKRRTVSRISVWMSVSPSVCARRPMDGAPSGWRYVTGEYPSSRRPARSQVVRDIEVSALDPEADALVRSQDAHVLVHVLRVQPMVPRIAHQLGVTCHQRGGEPKAARLTRDRDEHDVQRAVLWSVHQHVGCDRLAVPSRDEHVGRVGEEASPDRVRHLVARPVSVRRVGPDRPLHVIDLPPRRI